MTRWICCAALLAACHGALVFAPEALAQQESVRPGINAPFRDPNPQEFVGKFEIESREVFAHRTEIVAACEIRPGMTVADIGAGTGLFTRLFSTAVGDKGKVIAVDIAPKFLDHIRRTTAELGRQNVETLEAAPDTTRLPAGSVDLAFICDTYHHFEFPQRTMASIRQALKPGGRVVLVDFERIAGRSTEWTMSHVRAGRDVFEREIEEAGFRKTDRTLASLTENYLTTFVLAAEPAAKSAAADPALVYPIIAKYGGVVPVPNGASPPRTGAKVVFDVTADAKPADVHKGLERVARLLNLYGTVGLSSKDVQIAVVFHGEATKSILSDAAYKSRFDALQNPNLPLIAALREAGVELFVCGQALHYKGFAQDEVAHGVGVATAALTVLINKQMDGFADIPVH